MRFGPTVQEDFYRIKSEPPGPPTPGLVLLERRAGMKLRRITWPDKSTIVLAWDGSREFSLRLKQAGMPDCERLKKALNYVWEFKYAYYYVPGAVSPPEAILSSMKRGVLRNHQASLPQVDQTSR